MSPVAIAELGPYPSDSWTEPIRQSKSFGVDAPYYPTGVALTKEREKEKEKEVPRRPSPWHEIAHSLSTTSLPPLPSPAPRRTSNSNAGEVVPYPQPLISRSSPIALTPTSACASSSSSTRDSPNPGPSPTLSSSQALREWEWLLSQPDSEVKRHQLLHPRTPSVPNLHQHQHQHQHQNWVQPPKSPYGYPSVPARAYGSPVIDPPKLAAERDKEGHIEYKLKLINPTPDRFERLVTQMMWRLKQGKNEAIYEIGLADDGTVIGLTRAEMDASLHTLELMASEVGATVLILKEIVLTGTPLNLPAPRRSSASNTSSPALSSSIPSSATSRSSAEGRPTYDRLADRESGRGTRTPNSERSGVAIPPFVSSKIGIDLSRKDKIVNGVQETIHTQPGGKLSRRKLLIFEPADVAGDRSDSDEPEDKSGGDDRYYRAGPSYIKTQSMGRNRAASRSSSVATDEEDIPQFHLDLEDVIPPALEGVDPVAGAGTGPGPGPGSGRKRWGRRRHAVPADQVGGKKSEAKRLKLAAKREARRLSLLRGDGTSSIWDTATHESRNSPENASTVIGDAYRLPHQPARPSSLRLASPAPVPTTLPPPPPPSSGEDLAETDIVKGQFIGGEDNTGGTDDDDNFLNLLHLPLDSLSLSFADVRNFSPPPSSPSSSTEYAEPYDRDADFDLDSSEEDVHDANRGNTRRWGHDEQDSLSPAFGAGLAPAQQELICVEALVVRKVQHGHGADGDRQGTGVGEEEEEEEAWGYGGGDDGWGFGAEDD